MRDLFPAQADLAHALARITDRQHRNLVSFAPRALRAAAPVPNGAIQQRPAKDLHGGWQLRNQSVTLSDGLLSIHC